MNRVNEPKSPAQGPKVGVTDEYKQLRLRLLEMIRRNEALRRAKPR